MQTGERKEGVKERKLERERMERRNVNWGEREERRNANCVEKKKRKNANWLGERKERTAVSVEWVTCRRRKLTTGE